MKNKNKYSPISFGEFKLNNASRRYVNGVLDSNWLTMGSVVKKLEKKWCQLFDYPYAKAVNSGTSALIACFLSLYEFGAKQGDNIICPALSFIATANAIRAAGFVPRFVDVELETLNIDVNKIRKNINKDTVAICAVNLMGRPAELDKIWEIATNNHLNKRLYVVVDDCEGYGSQYKDKYSLEYADYTVSSHYSAHICCAAELGMVGCRTKEQDDLIDSVRSHGRPTNSLYFDHQRFGLNLKTTDLHAAVGLGEFQQFHSSFNKRKKNLNELIEHSKQYRQFAYFNQEDDDIYYSAPHGFNILINPLYEFYYPNGIKTRYIEHIKSIFDKYNIQWKRTFGSMPTQHKCFEYLGHKLGEFPNAEYIGDNSIHLGVHKFLSCKDMRRIKLAIDECFKPLRDLEAREKIVVGDLSEIFPWVKNYDDKYNDLLNPNSQYGARGL